MSAIHFCFAATSAALLLRAPPVGAQPRAPAPELMHLGDLSALPPRFDRSWLRAVTAAIESGRRLPHLAPPVRPTSAGPGVAPAPPPMESAHVGLDEADLPAPAVRFVLISAGAPVPMGDLQRFGVGGLAITLPWIVP